MTAQGVRYLDLVRVAVLATTPHNNQPWRFFVRDGKLLVHLDDRHALPSDVFGMLGMLGIGAAIENTRIAAAAMGLESQVEYGLERTSLAGDSPRQIATFDSLVPRAAGRVLFILFQLGNASRPQMHSVRRSAEDVFSACTD